MFLDDLQLKLENYESELPGWEAQARLSPPYREKYDLEEIKKTNPRIAAVMILLYENEDGEIVFPVTLRHTYDGVHSNQFSLPGGAFEPEDINLSYTAIRETVEELGVEEENIEILKQLSELYIPPSNFVVYPFIGIHHGSPEFLPEEAEVAEIIPIDLEAFLQAEPMNFERVFGEYTVDIPGYELGDESYIWGATAMILSEFGALLEKL
ncbi:NUDIX hydrolase [Moheibacter lacus]|uniref:NUDIX hydrolase n=1 Tax=Moheibacter lacus TaxID=2745851 RepID=UPI001C715F8A|nr:CoA pyrophosphatase [Moheibacter lacus]